MKKWDWRLKMYWIRIRNKLVNLDQVFKISIDEDQIIFFGNDLQFEVSKSKHNHMADIVANDEEFKQIRSYIEKNENKI